MNLNFSKKLSGKMLSRITRNDCTAGEQKSGGTVTLHSRFRIFS